MRRFKKSVGHALNGLRVTFKSERNFKIQVIVMAGAIMSGFFLKLSAIAWGLVILSSGFVLAAELFNTALERLSDELANGDHKPLIKYAKDISAAAVFISALTAIFIGILFLIIPFLRMIFEF